MRCLYLQQMQLVCMLNRNKDKIGQSGMSEHNCAVSCATFVLLLLLGTLFCMRFLDEMWVWGDEIAVLGRCRGMVKQAVCCARQSRGVMKGVI